jgi:hypothetical protein
MNAPRPFAIEPSNRRMDLARTPDRIVPIWPMFVCAVLGVAARVDLVALRMARLELVMAAVSASAAFVLIDAWARDAGDIRGGGARAIFGALWCAFCAIVGS